jgi:hypothetical protein
VGTKHTKCQHVEIVYGTVPIKNIVDYTEIYNHDKPTLYTHSSVCDDDITKEIIKVYTHPYKEIYRQSIKGLHTKQILVCESNGFLLRV